MGYGVYNIFEIVIHVSCYMRGRHRTSEYCPLFYIGFSVLLVCACVLHGIQRIVKYFDCVSYAMLLELMKILKSSTLDTSSTHSL